MRRLSLPLLAVFGIALGFGPWSAFAATTGSMKVTVIDEKKESVIGATVTLSDVNKQHPDQSLMTNEDGQASFAIVQPGSTYTVTVVMPGYSKQVRGNVQVRANQWTQVGIQLLTERVETVTVTAKDKVVELDADAQAKTEISAEAFGDLPIFGRDYKAALPLAAGVQDSDGDGNPNVNGSRDRDFAMTVDGVSNVDPLTGRAMSEINPDSIEEIVVATAGADASYGGAVGGFGKIITKSGGNNFQASGEFRFRDGTFDFDGAEGGVSQGSKRRQPSASFSGPIIKDKLFFRLDHSYTSISEPVDVLGGKTFNQNLEQWSHSDKLTWNVNPKNKLNLLWRADPATIEPVAVDTIRPAETGATVEYGGPTMTLTWTAPFSPSFFWEATVGMTDIDTEVAPYKPGNRNNCIQPSNANYSFFEQYYCDDLVGYEIYSGTYPIISNDNRKIVTWKIDAEQFIDRWLGGSHRIRFGADLSRREYNRDVTYAPQMQREQPGVSGGVVDPDAGNNGGANSLVLNVQNFYFPGRGIQSGIYEPQQGVNTSIGNDIAFYLTDTYEPMSNLSITIGARLMREELRADGYSDLDPAGDRAQYDSLMASCREERCAELCNITTGSAVRCERCLAAQCASQIPVVMQVHPLDDPQPALAQGGCLVQGVAVNPQTCELLYRGDRPENSYLPEGGLRFRSPNTFTIANVDIDPRISVSWDPWNDNKTRLSASWGKYTQNMYLEPLVYENGPDNLNKQFGLQINNGQVDFNNGSLFDSDLTAGGSRSSSAFTVYVVDRDLQREYAKEFNFTAEREIAPETSLSLSYVNRKYENQLQDTDINHVPISDEDMRTRVPGEFDPSLAGQDCPLVNGFWDCGGDDVRIPNPDPSGTGGAGYTLTNVPDGLADLKVVNPFFNNIYQIGNYNSSQYVGYTLQLERRYFNSWEMTASYTYSKATGQAEDFVGSLGNDSTNADDEEGLLSYDQTHVVKVYGRVQLPYFGGFRLAGNLSFQSGLPYSIVERNAVYDFPDDPFAGQMEASGFTKRTAGGRFLTFRQTYPTGQRNDQRNPAWWDLDVTAQKEFQLRTVKTTVNFTINNVLNDNSVQTLGVIRRVAYRTPAGVNVYDYNPIAQRRFGRQFELAIRFNWGG